MEDMLALVKEKLTEQTVPSPNTGGDTSLVGEAVPERDEDANIWGEEESADYLEEDFEEGVDDFVPELELDEAADNQD